MLKYLNKQIGELAHQLTIAPRRLRTAQLKGIDRLLDLVHPDKSYPYDWVCFHITGHRPIKLNHKPDIPGRHLLGDLPTMADHITRKAAMRESTLPWPCQTHDVVAEQMGVSTKTIRRWRARGLLGFRAVGEDGVARLMFSAGAVKRFRERNADLVARGAAFRQLTEIEKDQIVESARSMLARKREKLHLVARRIASETGRAVETIRYTLRQFDRAHADEALFGDNGGPLLSKRHLAIWQCHQKGESAKRIASTLGCDADSIRAIIREIEARRLKEQAVSYVDHELFHAPHAEELILGPPRPGAGNSKGTRVRAPNGLPPYLRHLYETPLLTPEQEVDLFRRYNYVKFSAAQAIGRLDVYSVPQADLDAIHTRLAEADGLKREIVQANLRLVVSIAKRHVGWSDNLFEVISDGNMSLFRAVEKFDYALGNKFSTYASWAIMKNYARTIPEAHYHLNRYVTGQDAMLDATADQCPQETPASDLESIREALHEGLTHLTERERTIVTRHFGLGGPDRPPATLEALGRQFGVTKERIRQIEKRAITKLRGIISPGLIDAVSG